jgi:hypothetical protein
VLAKILSGVRLSRCGGIDDISEQDSDGDYNVYAWWITGSSRATNAPYTINYDGGSETVRVNQKATNGQWNLLGTYPFRFGTSGDVVLSDGPDADGVVIADAIMVELVHPHRYAPVAKTGQTTSYAQGDDGDLEKGVAWPEPRFMDNEDGTVTDSLTGLIWLKDANCDVPKQWADAIDYCWFLANGMCGLSDGSSEGDWRLPNVRELQSLIDYGNVNPALPAGYSSFFTNVQQSDYYWSSTTSGGSTNIPWYMRMGSGVVSFDCEDCFYYVWPVRAGN